MRKMTTILKIYFSINHFINNSTINLLDINIISMLLGIPIMPNIIAESLITNILKNIILKLEKIN